MGTLSPSIGFVGDSLTGGGWSDGTAGGLWSNALPVRTGQALAGYLGVPVAGESFFGDQNLTAEAVSYSHFNPRLSVGTGWAATTNMCLGAAIWGNGTTTNSLGFAPTSAFNAVDVWYVTGPGLGSFTIDIGGSGSVTINAAAASYGVAKASASVASTATYCVNVHPVSGQVYIVGMATSDNHVVAARCFNTGWGGARAQDWAANAWNWIPFAGISALAADLWVLMLSTNDALQGIALSIFVSNMQNLISAMQVSGDVILGVPPQMSTAVLADAAQLPFRKAISGLARSNGCAVMNFHRRYDSYVAMNGAGMMGNTIHPNGYGYSDMGAALARVIAEG